MADPVTETKRHPEASMAAGTEQVQYFRVIHEFVDSHGSRWVPHQIISLTAEDVDEALAAGAVEEYVMPYIDPLTGLPAPRPAGPGVAPKVPPKAPAKEHRAKLRKVSLFH